jgi:cold shock CspA family protein
MTGAIRSLGKGYAFIAGDDGKNYYLHWSGMRVDMPDFRELQMRQRLDFQVISARAPVSGQGHVPAERAVDAVIIDAIAITETEGGS